ncbi:MAG: ribonuclease D [Rickettsiales bacterium]|nr:ribonuclease D [Rickettsiales bacterium]
MDTMYQLITTTQELQAACDDLSTNHFLTVDTEFIREKTYYPKLCLIQVAGEDHNFIIDPLAEGMDLSAFFKLMENPEILKIFHAAQQDVEIFVRLTGSVPSPIFDTQIAAMVCGFGESVGYEALVNKLLGKSLDKASRYTDWEQRPLTERQLKYAIADVTHLRAIYEELSDKIEAQGRHEWIAEELDKLSQLSQYQIDPEESWRRLKYKNRSPEYLNLLRAAASWRERLAQVKNIPRGRLLKDEVLLQIANMNPKNMEELAQVRGALKHLNADNAQALMAALEAAREKDKDEYPKDEKRKPMLSPEQEALADVLKMLLKLQCEQTGVASKLVAKKEDIVALLLEQPDLDCLKGWRNEVFGQYAIAFLEGKLILKSQDKRISFVEA